MPGTSLSAGKPVVLKIFTKPEAAPAETKRIAVPSLVGLKAAAVRERLGSSKLAAVERLPSRQNRRTRNSQSPTSSRRPTSWSTRAGAAVVVRIFPRYQEPAAKPVPENPLPKPANDKKVPNLVGLTVRQAMDRAEAAGLSIGSYEDTGAVPRPSDPNACTLRFPRWWLLCRPMGKDCVEVQRNV